MKTKFDIDEEIYIVDNGRYFYGTVRKIEIRDDAIVYFINFSPNNPYIPFDEQQLGPVYIVKDPPQEAKADRD